MINFQEIPKDEIYISHNNHYHDDARYFGITKNHIPMCIYGVISRSDKTSEAFWILDSFSKKVLTKEFFQHLFNHLFSLGYEKVYTWTRCKKLINVFDHFKKLGIERSECPAWDCDESKTWFMKRI